MHTKKAAFTLIELLVVISIIGVLAGLLLPVYSKVQENGRISKCTSNLRQIGVALIAFAGDNNGTLPLAGATIPYTLPSQRTGALGWTEQLEPYTGGTDRSIYLCPSSKLVIPKNNPYSYFMGCHAAYFANANQFAAVRLPLIASPSRFILGGDIASNSLYTAADDSDKDDYTQNPAFASNPPPFHNGKSNVLFADGHVAGFTAFDSNFMTTHYDLKSDGTGYNYSDQ